MNSSSSIQKFAALFLRKANIFQFYACLSEIAIYVHVHVEFAVLQEGLFVSILVVGREIDVRDSVQDNWSSHYCLCIPTRRREEYCNEMSLGVYFLVDHLSTSRWNLQEYKKRTMMQVETSAAVTLLVDNDDTALKGESKECVSRKEEQM